MAYQCAWTVARIDESVFIQREYPFADGLQQNVHFPAPQIGSADALLKERIPREEFFITTHDSEAHSTRAVPRRVDDLQFVVTENDLLLIRDPLLNGRRILELHAEQFPLHREILIKELISFVQTDLSLRLAVHHFRGADVIKMRVSVKNVFYEEPARRDFLEDAHPFIAWVDEHRFFGFFTA